MKSNIDLKREYWSQPELFFTPKMIDALVAEYGDKPATSGEAAFVLRYRFKELGQSIIKVFTDWREERERVRDLNHKLENLTNHMFFVRYEQDLRGEL